MWKVADKALRWNVLFFLDARRTGSLLFVFWVLLLMKHARQTTLLRYLWAQFIPKSNPSFRSIPDENGGANYPSFWHNLSVRQNIHHFHSRHVSRLFSHKSLPSYTFRDRPLRYQRTLTVVVCWFLVGWFKVNVGVAQSFIRGDDGDVCTHRRTFFDRTL